MPPSFKRGLGRIMNATGAMHKFMNLYPRDSVRRVPGYVSFTLQYLTLQVEDERHYSCSLRFGPAATATRVDAQASGETLLISDAGSACRANRP